MHKTDPVEAWAREVGIDASTAHEIIDWVLERLDSARGLGVHPVVFLQTAGLMWWMAAEACRMPESRLEELRAATWPKLRDVARHVVGGAEPLGGKIGAAGLEIVGG